MWKWEGNYLTKLHSMITHILTSWFKTFDLKKIEASTERWKNNFPKEIVENVDLHKPVLNKIITTQE